jgi:valyl-tRNA synthetase
VQLLPGRPELGDRFYRDYLMLAVSASLVAEDVTVEINLAGTVDVEAERKRLEKDLAAARKEAAQTSGKLGNESFMAKAPADVVAKTRQRLADAEADITRLEGRLAALCEYRGRQGTPGWPSGSVPM